VVSARVVFGRTQVCIKAHRLPSTRNDWKIITSKLQDFESVYGICIFNT
jgi:hypothetical protein